MGLVPRYCNEYYLGTISCVSHRLFYVRATSGHEEVDTESSWLEMPEDSVKNHI